jgi:hypothetical protein
MPKNETITLAEKLWKENANARKKKVVEKAAILLHSYYHLKKQSEAWEGVTAKTAADKKMLEQKLTTLQGQLEEIEAEIKRWQKEVVGELEQTLALDQLTKAALKVAPDKSTRTGGTVLKLPAHSDMLAPLIEQAQKNAADPGSHAKVWAELVKMAVSAQRPAPLVGYSEKEGVAYLDEHDVRRVLTKPALAAEMRKKTR